VHAHYATYGALGAWVIKRLTGVPYTFTAHAHDLFVEQTFLREKVEEAEAVVAVSEYNRRFLADYGGGAATPVTVIRCGIDVGAYPYRERSLDEAGEIRALCVASLQDYKGHSVLLRALAADRGALGRISLTLVGDGPLEGSLRREAERLGVASQVRFAGAMAEDQVAAELEAAQLFVLPSVVASSGQMEGVPVALMEAMACGVPVVSTRLSGIPELVRDGDTGLLAQPGDPEALAAAMRSAIEDSEASAERARRGRALVEREFDVHATSDALVRVLEGGAVRG
jgi:glycosyltransferase involved in cell wall biosynthesis